MSLKRLLILSVGAFVLVLAAAALHADAGAIFAGRAGIDRPARLVSCHGCGWRGGYGPGYGWGWRGYGGYGGWSGFGSWGDYGWGWPATGIYADCDGGGWGPYYGYNSWGYPYRRYGYGYGLRYGRRHYVRTRHAARFRG